MINGKGVPAPGGLLDGEAQRNSVPTSSPPRPGTGCSLSQGRHQLYSSQKKNKHAVGPQLVLYPGSLDPPIHIMGIKERGPSDANGKGSINGCI